MGFNLRRRSARPGTAAVVLWFAALHGVVTVCSADDGANRAALRRVIEKSVPYIEREGDTWIETKGCISCHRMAFTAWSLNAAQRVGIAIDPSGLKRRSEWARDWHNLSAPPHPAKDRESATQGHCDALAQLLLGNEQYASGKDRPEWVKGYSHDLAKGQQSDGSWTPGGQLPSQKRPKRETQEVTTMWSLLALKASGTDAPALKSAVDKARAWLGDKTIGESTEWWTARLLLERQFGSTGAGDHFRDELLKRQRADGGWGWLCKDESDALGTGLAIFALRSEKGPQSAPAIAKAQQFLVRTQGADGSWPVHGTKENAKDRVVPTATYWGTCWAVIGLSATIRD
jgi:hypothetical protein